MQYRTIPAAVVAAVLLAGGSLCLAADKAETVKAPATASTSKATPKSKKPKPVDINRASAAELKTVPGLGDAEADRIVKGRPYPTKAHLVTESVLSYEAYIAVKDRLIAKPVGRPLAKK